MRKAQPTYIKRRPFNLSSSTSNPARKSRKASPSTERMEIGRSILTHPRTDGPITIPATISSTIAGKRRAGVSASKSGAAKATTATMSNPENETFGITTSHLCGNSQSGPQANPTLTPHPPPHVGHDRGLAFQATLQVQPADKRLSLVLRICLVIDTSLIECFDSDKASNLLARKTHVLELPIICLPGRVVRHSGELLSKFHGHPPVPPSRLVLAVRLPTPASGSRIGISQFSLFSLDRLLRICLIIDVQWR